MAATQPPGSEPATAEPRQLPANPAAYDADRNVHARQRGLSAPYIAGGRDPDPESGRAEERRFLRLLLIMVVVLVLAGFVVGIVGALLGINLE